MRLPVRVGGYQRVDQLVDIDRTPQVHFPLGTNAFSQNGAGQLNKIGAFCERLVVRKTAEVLDDKVRLKRPTPAFYPAGWRASSCRTAGSRPQILAGSVSPTLCDRLLEFRHGGIRGHSGKWSGTMIMSPAAVSWRICN